MTALGHLRVVELSRDVAAAYCARQFAAWGADVVTLEPDAGSPLRRRGPLARSKDHHPPIFRPQGRLDMSPTATPAL